jgi:hypothetical protein
VLLDERDAGRIRGIEARRTGSGGGIVVNGEGQLQKCDVGKRGRRDTGTKNASRGRRRGVAMAWTVYMRKRGQQARTREEGAAMWSQTAYGGRHLRSDRGGAAVGGNSKTAATALSSEAERMARTRGGGRRCWPARTRWAGARRDGRSSEAGRAWRRRHVRGRSGRRSGYRANTRKGRRRGAEEHGGAGGRRKQDA